MPKNTIGDRFQHETRYARKKVPSGQFDHIERPAPYKKYPAATRVSLPQPDTGEGTALWETIGKRRSVRDFKDREITLDTLSQLLWATQGITGKTEHFSFRAAPSAGALYPMETYVVVNNTQGLEPGLYHYAIEDHELELLTRGDLRGKVSKAALNQYMCAEANVVFIWTAIFARSKWKYKQRAYRYVYLDCGHICQNLCLTAVALKMGSCPIAAFYDDEVNELIGVDGKEESTLYLCAVGAEKQ